ncbi:MAG: CTP synthase [Candidatus Jorgensenbacteria bacterium GW2011_GWA1_48_11]|uniref:CTP synthase n=1 Tax=Candidatus Jorgensenbacteria bacterium GW2011_GWA1_48_11 TaxID=1618660 RepID=A0A0G1WM51_9BACT|nr:MAG: CTP synthase [Candidatus Jorgensenbacteria bacterium GW2011_GWA1_48_11]KKW11913.1 MAG: CTP synthase [Candidatus Jorgensenbacteria bacterium GW2011_GWB1_49_9]
MTKDNLKFIFITGGVVSGVGKGISVASIGALLKMRGLKVLPIKIDPYLNRDAGTMNPYQHGEVFVTDDGAETDLDLGHYERFMDLSLGRDSNFTTGVVYEHVIHMERHGDFLGKTIQIIPHVTNEIKRRIIEAGRDHKAQVVIVEIGGTAGDIEAEPFLEAARQIFGEYGSGRVAFVHVVKMDYIFPSDEAKTKPIQQSVAILREKGIQPDFLIVRCKRALTADNKEKISLFGNIRPDYVIPALDVQTVYEVPINFRKCKFDRSLLERLRLPVKKANFTIWDKLAGRLKSARRVLRIALVGKYIENVDAYLSVEESLKHAAASENVKLEIFHIDSGNDNIGEKLKGAGGIVVPGGFGVRGIEGKIRAVEIARESNIPFLGLCLGMQVAVIEFARNACGLVKANSTEFDRKTKHPVIDILPDQRDIKNLGGTMRLGAYAAEIKEKTLVEKLYGSRRISERHRHRYEVNPKYHEILKKRGLVFSGIAAHDKRIVEFVELPKHRFFVATQAHPEFKSRLVRPHPLFWGLVRAAAGKKQRFGL